MCVLVCLFKPASPVEEKKKKPVGGVSMFAGMDPFGVKKKLEVRPTSPGITTLYTYW